MPLENGPDFLCIGMQKAGTAWLYDQLKHHPDFWIPLVKEFHYLDRDIVRMSNPRKLLEMMQRAPKRLEKHRRPWDERDVEFLNEAASLAGKPRDIAQYAALFRFKNGLLTGDITPGYSRLSDEVVAEVGRALPGVKIVLMIRDPLDRAWSQICMAARNDRFDTGLLKEPERFRAFLESSEEVNSRSFPTRMVARWREHAPNVALQYYFLDDVIASPEETRRRVLTFLGADPGKSSGAVDADHNRKSKNVKLPLTDDIRTVMVDHFRGELLACVNLFGTHAEGWASRYGL